MKELIKKNKGITLIALIITIIILIILTAVTINNVIGTDLIGFTTKAVENYTDAAEDEVDKVDKLATALDNQGVGEDSAVRAGEIVTAETKTEKDGDITYNYTDAQGRHAMVPEGFKVSTKSSEQYIKDGLVIQDEQGNEFVWVPCYYGDTKPNGTADDIQQYKEHEYEGAKTGVDDTTGTIDSGNGNWMTRSYIKYKDNWFDEAVEKMDKETNAITKDENSYGNKSVRKYGGFYIGRYEAGWDETDTSKFTKDTVPYITSIQDETNKKNVQAIETGKKPISKQNVFTWNFISQINAKKVSELMYSDSDSVDSKLIDGAAWDTAINWIATAGADVTKSIEYGNYIDTNKSYSGWYAEHIIPGNKGQATYTGFLCSRNFIKGPIQLQEVILSNNPNLWEDKKNNYTDSNKCDTTKNYLNTRIELPTGSYKDFELKNIYDLAGNMWEWTSEVDYYTRPTNGNPTKEEVPKFATIRGGCFGSAASNDPLNKRAGSDNASGTAIWISFRVVLYIK